jgi:polyhydroxyalkanoate synthesis repressor PhaR
MDSRRIVIRKYENRRLYDTSSSRYVNLDGIAQMVRAGIAVRMVDPASGENLTRLVLRQIIVGERRPTPVSVVYAAAAAGR